MKKAIKKISLFLSIPFLFWAWSYWNFQKQKSVIYPRLYSTDEAILNAPDTFPYLIAGHSRLFRGIDTSQINNTIVIATPGESFIESYYKLKYIFETKKKHPEIVLLPFEMGTFKPNDFRRSFYWKKYVNFLEVGWQKKEIADYGKEYLISNLFPFRQFYQQQISSFFQSKISKNKSPKRSNKSMKRFSDYSSEERLTMIQKDIELLTTVKLMDQVSKYYVHKTLNLCRQHQVKLVYIKCPLTTQYKTELEKLVLEQGYTEQPLSTLINQFENATLIDLKSAFENKDDYFFDHHHLNNEGSSLFTNSLLENL